MDFHTPDPRWTVDPHLLGPLTDDPTVEDGSSLLFPGERRWLSARAVHRKRALLEGVTSVLGSLLTGDERIVYLLAAHQQPTFWQIGAFGWTWYRMHQVALVLTNQRLIEILMDLRGSKPSTRIRSYPWAGVGKLKPGAGKLAVTMIDGGKHAWRIGARGDRKLLKQLAPKIRALIDQRRGTLLPEDAHYWHCPRCFGRVAPNPEACGTCGTRFRTTKAATLLALAFPGAGLLYAQRYYLGTLDLIGELFLYGLAVSMLVFSSRSEDIAIFGGLAGFMLVATKVESVHLSRILVRRARPVSERAAAGWRRFAWSGGGLSIAALLLAGAVTGRLAPTLARDLEFQAAESGWLATRMVEEFSMNEDGDQRSEWFHPESGQGVVVFAYVLDPWTEFDTWVDDFLASLGAQGLDSMILDKGFSPGFTGVGCFVSDGPLSDAEWLHLNYLVWDERSPAVHHVYSYFPADYRAEAMRRLETLFGTATWIPVADPGS